MHTRQPVSDSAVRTTCRIVLDRLTAWRDNADLMVIHGHADDVDMWRNQSANYTALIDLLEHVTAPDAYMGAV